MKSCATPPLFSEQTIDAIVEEALEAFGVPGLAVAVLNDEKILCCKGYGLRDRELGLKVTQDTLFPIASNTKAFTSLLLAQLIEENKAAWDDPVVLHLPRFTLYTKELSAEVTLRDLIAHRTGIPRHDVLWYLVRELSAEDLLKTLPHLPPVSSLRESFQYNNFMYVVAAEVIKTLAKRSWEEELFRRILNPLEMKQSCVCPEAFQKRAKIAQPYATIRGKIQKLPFLYPHSTRAASALHSSISDMAKWVQAQLRPGFISQQILDEMHTIHMPTSSSEPTTGYGLGWEINSYRETKRVQHSGTIEGFFSHASLLPKKKLGLVLLTNSSTDGRYAVSSIENSLYDLLLGVKACGWLEKIQAKRLEDKRTLCLFDLSCYAGSYAHPAYGTMHIALESDSLVATLGNMRVLLREKTEGVFVASYPELLAYGVDPRIPFTFSANSSGQIVELSVPFEHFRAAPPVVFRK